MNGPRPVGWESLARLPMDDVDARLMGDIAELYTAVDPVPTGLVDRVTAALTLDPRLMGDIAEQYTEMDPVPDGLVDRVNFALTLDALHAEVAELQRLPLAALAARGEQTSELTTLTFTSDSLTLLITIRPAGPDRVQIDGWAASAPGAVVELRQANVSREEIADDDGYFVFDDVPRGSTRFAVRGPGPTSRPLVVTPSVEI